MQRSVQDKDLRNIKNRTIDSFQGKKTVMIILDMVITDRLGSVRQMNRLNVALKRAQDGSSCCCRYSRNQEEWSAWPRVVGCGLHG